MKIRGIFGGSDVADQALLEAGQVAQERGDSKKALQMWAKHRERYPSDPAGYAMAGSAERGQKRYDAAEAILAEGLRRCANDVPVAIEYAWVAHDRANWPETLRRWQRVLTKFPFHPVASGGAAQALIELERFAEAEQYLAPVREVFPGDYYFTVTSAIVSTKLKDWKEALSRWEQVLKIKPDSATAKSYIEVVRKFAAAT